jgi:hypothetical protein
MGSKRNTANLDAVVQFRVTRERKEEIEQFAHNIGISVGEMMRGITETIEVLYDPELRFADVIRSIPELKERIANRKDQTA